MTMGNTKRKGNRSTWLTAMAVGAALAFFLDPDRGTRRRNMARDRLGAFFRRLSSRSARLAQHAGSQAYGIVQESVPHPRDNPNPDDRTLRDRIESEVLRDPKIKQSDVIFNVVGGVAELRGEMKSQQDIDDLITRVQSIPDVKGVISYLHLPGTPAPNKASALHTS
jgi:osmotically-inducible protein OsmY